MILDVQDTSGKIVIADMQGAVTLRDSSGTIEVRNVAGPLNIAKESGDIRVTGVLGATTIASGSGQMRLERLGALRIEHSDGNLDISDIASAFLMNRGGNIHVNRVKQDLNIDDDGGEIEVCDVGGPVAIRDTSGQIRACRTGALLVDDTSGDITVDGAPSVDVRTKESGQVKVRNVAGVVHVPQNIALNRN